MDSIWWVKIYDPGDHSSGFSRFLAFIIYFCLGVLNCGNLLWKHWLLLEMPRKNSKNGRLQAWSTLHRHHESSSGLPTFFDSGRQHEVEVFQDNCGRLTSFFPNMSPTFSTFFQPTPTLRLEISHQQKPQTSLCQVDPPSEQMLPNERVGSPRAVRWRFRRTIRKPWGSHGDQIWLG